MQSLQVITAKQLANSMGVHLNTAQTYMKDIKLEYGITIVLLCHVHSYFKVNAK